MNVGVRPALLFLWLGACCFSGNGGGGLGSLLSGPTLRYTPDPWLVNGGATYDSSRLADGNPSTYWSAPAGTPFPIVTILQLDSPSSLMSLDFDTRVVGYETSGLREVTIEPLGAGGMPLGVPVNTVLNANAITTVPVSQSGVQAVRLTFRSNYGGSSAVLAELALRSDMGVGLAPLPPIPAMVPPSPSPYPTSLPPPMPSIGMVSGSVSPGLPYIVDAIGSTPGYPTDLLHDGNPATYWCSEASPYFPYVMTLTLTPGSTVSAIEIDSTNAAYPTIGPRDVTILTISPLGAILNVTNGYAEPNGMTRIPLVAPVNAAQLRVTLQNNHGGPLAGINELRVLP